MFEFCRARSAPGNLNANMKGTNFEHPTSKEEKSDEEKQKLRGRLTAGWDALNVSMLVRFQPPQLM